MDIFAHAIPEPNTGCWLWLGSINGGGYGRYKHTYAHRSAYEVVHGPIAAGLHIDHLCRVTCCVNPDHLEAVTPLENMRRAARARAGLSAGTETHCARGHELSVVGQRPRTNRPGKVCLGCHRIYQRRSVSKLRRAA